MFQITSHCSLHFIPNESKCWDNVVESLVPENVTEKIFDEKKEYKEWIKKDASCFLKNDTTITDFPIREFTEKKEGNETENTFYKICDEQNINYIKSSKKQDYYDHFDVVLFLNNEDWNTKQGVFVDIKGKKSLRRNGPKQTKYFFVELHKEGWMYNSKADYIAIDVSLQNNKTKFLIYDKKKLIHFMEKNIRTDLPLVSWPEQCLLRVYIRKYKMRSLHHYQSEKICATALSLLPTFESFQEAGVSIFE